MTTLTKQYFTGLVAIILLVAVVARMRATLRTVGAIAFMLFAGLDAWYIFKIRKAPETAVTVNWRKEATIIVVCLALLLLLLLKNSMR